MRKNEVAVYVEKNCADCQSVLEAVQSVAAKRNVNIKIFDREKDYKLFQERGVVICPATYINDKLIFYGTFTMSALLKYLL